MHNEPYPTLESWSLGICIMCMCLCASRCGEWTYFRILGMLLFSGSIRTW